MAKQIKKKSRFSKSKSVSPFKNYWQKHNYVLLGAGIVTLIVGFYLMTFGPWDNPVSLTISPLILLIAYLVIFPVSILYKKKQNNRPEEDVSSED